MSENMDNKSEDVNPDSESKESEKVFSYSLDEEEVDDLAHKVEDILDANQDEEVKELRENIDSLRDSVRATDQRLDFIQNETKESIDSFEDKIEDAREKIVGLAKKQSRKSEKDHSHPNIVESISDIEQELEEVESTLQSQLRDLKSEIEKVSDRESELREKTTNLAHSHLDLRDDYRQSAESSRDEDDLDNVLIKAQEKQVTKADCQDCSSKVNIGLLRESKCPFCESQLEDLKTRFIRSDYLVTEESNSQS